MLGVCILTARRAALAALALAAVVPATAEAGVYHHWGCRTPSGAAAPMDGWDSGGTPAAAVVLTCGTANGSIGLAAGNASGVASASMTYRPGPGLTVDAATLWRAMRAIQSAPAHAPDFPLAMVALAVSYPQDSLGNPYYYYGMDGAYGEGNTADDHPDDAIVGTTADPFAAANRVELAPMPQGFPDAPIKFDTTCNNWNWQYACDASYRITAYDVKLRDDSAPSVAAVAGTLVNGSGKIDSASTMSGSRNVVVAGSDTGSGIYRTVVVVDGAEVASGSPTTGNPSRCAPSAAGDGLRAYVVRQPCPLSAGAAATWDTTKVKDGTHDVRVLLEDASGNKTVVTEGKLTVKNAAPLVTPTTPVNPTTPGSGGGVNIGPESPPEVRGEVNGSVATESAMVVLGWPASARAASKKASTIRRCKQPKWAAKHVVQCQGRPAQPALATTWSATKTVDVAGRVTDPQGVPLASATITLVGTPAAVGAAPQPLATVETDASGAFTAAVPRATGSQVIVAEWRARLADTKPAATATATLTVAAATTLSAPRKVKRRSRVTFSGALLGKAGLLEKVPVRLQVQDGRRWWTFATASTDATGKWKTTAKFANRPGTYVVRAKIDSATTYPFAGGASTKLVRVKVR